MSIEIFYFTGTGNSLFVAKELIDRLPDSKLTPMIKSLNENRCYSEADTVGFVFPVHALSIPVVVRRFIEKLSMKSAKYIFAVATRGGTSFHGFKKIESILKPKSLVLHSGFIINMVLNDARNHIFRNPTTEALDSMRQQELEKISLIASDVIAMKRSNGIDNEVTIKSAKTRIGAFLVERIVLIGMDLAGKTKGVNYFYSDEKCNKCGVCQRVCTSGKIANSNEGPIWNDGVFCSMCYACINYCPQHAIQIKDVPYVKSYTRVNGRYQHRNASITDIENQKT